MKKAIIYRRVSTKEQGEYGYSLQAQQADIMAYALKNGFAVMEDIPEDESGMTLDRPGLTRIRELLRSGKASVLIAHDSDRVSRNPADYLALRDELAVLGVELHYSQRGQVSIGTFGGDVVEDLYGRFAFEWRRKLLENCRNGKRTKVRTGKVIVAKRPPYGYRLSDGALVIHEPEAQIIRLIYRWYVIDGKSMFDISVELSRLKTPSYVDLNGRLNLNKKRPVGSWSMTSVRRIITNETYAGVWYWGKQKTVKIDGKRKQVWAPKDEWVAVEVPAIVDRATWEIAQRKIMANIQMSKRNQKRQYLMARRLTCGECGRPIYGATHREIGYYLCARTRKNFGPECRLPYFPVKAVDAVTWREVHKLLSNPDYFTQLAEKSLAEKPDRPTLVGRLEEATAKRARKERQLDRLLRTYLEDEDQEGAEYIKAKKELKVELADLVAEELELRAELSQVEARREALLGLGAALAEFQGSLQEEPPFEVKLEWIEALDVRGVVYVKDGRKLIDLVCDVGKLAAGIDIQSVYRYNGNWTIKLTLDIGVISS